MEKYNVMFIDDDVAILETFESMLRFKENEWNMTFAPSGEEAWQFMQDTQFDVITLDVDMPDINGIDLLKRIKADPKTSATKVVMVTGLQDADLKRQALELGAADLLPKPIRMIDLIARINNVLRVKRYEDELLEKNKTLHNQLAHIQFMELVGMIAAKNIHDLKNINMIIMGFLELMKMDVEPDSPLMESLSEMETATKRMDTRVKHILKVGKPSLNIRTLNVVDVLKEALAMIEPFFPKGKSAAWEEPVEKYYTRMAHARLIQVFLNLLIQATESVSKKETVSISLDTVNKESVPDCPEMNKDYLRIIIRDNGKSLSANALKRLCELDDSKEGVQQRNTGFLVSKEVMEEAGGCMKVSADPERGTIRTMLIPLVEKEEEKESLQDPLLRE